ncbi:MAG: type II toxin-antitoxin system RatA family toxin, partial [Geminicoccaceae bacterium]
MNEILSEDLLGHRVHCSLPYTRDQLFELAADVERYPDFVPWWVAARVWKREGNVYYTDQVIRFAMVSKRFGSKTILQRPERIDVTATDGSVRNLHLIWLFEAEAADRCQVSLAIDLELRSQLIRGLFAQALSRAVEPIMSAFEARAHQLCKPAPGSRNTTGGPA